MSIRNPSVAGFFYRSDKKGLEEEIVSCFQSDIGPGSLPKPAVKGKREVIGLIAPHAGYIYSGPVASHGYKYLAEDGLPDVFVIVGPNHTGIGSGVSLFFEGVWRTPLGDVKVDDVLSSRIVSNSSLIDRDITGHIHEHSIEVQIPFLQYIYALARKSFEIVPIVMLMQDLSTSIEVGEAIGRAIEGYEKDVVILASTDFTHYEPQQSAYDKDMRVIDRILNMDSRGVIESVQRYGVSMCGYGPVSTLLATSKVLGATSVRLLKYATSGDVTGDKSSVVAYASIVITK
jgi:hypothetical protein